jgi:hypothetical protein
LYGAPEISAKNIGVALKQREARRLGQREELEEFFRKNVPLRLRNMGGLISMMVM